MNAIGVVPLKDKIFLGRGTSEFAIDGLPARGGGAVGDLLGMFLNSISLKTFNENTAGGGREFIRAAGEDFLMAIFSVCDETAWFKEALMKNIPCVFIRPNDCSASGIDVEDENLVRCPNLETCEKHKTIFKESLLGSAYVAGLREIIGLMDKVEEIPVLSVSTFIELLKCTAFWGRCIDGIARIRECQERMEKIIIPSVIASN